MPLIRIHHPKGAIEPHQKTQLAQAFTTLLLKSEGAPYSPGARTLAYVIFREISRGTFVKTAVKPSTSILKKDSK